MVRLARSVAKGVADLQCRPVRNSRRKTRKFSLLTSGIEKRPLAGGHKKSASVDVDLLHCPIIFGFELRIHFVQCKSLESVNLITMVESFVQYTPIEKLYHLSLVRLCYLLNA
jgi:hypothetical protein